MDQLLNESKYVFDSGPFIDLKNYPNDIFSSLWDNFLQMIESGKIISSSEVLKELENYDDEIAKWAKMNKKIFKKPSSIETEMVTLILASNPELVKKENILSGRPTADPFVIAQAKINNCILVHREKMKPNAHRIPNICLTFGVKDISLFDFFRLEGWKF